MAWTLSVQLPVFFDFHLWTQTFVEAKKTQSCKQLFVSLYDFLSQAAKIIFKHESLHLDAKSVNIMVV